MFLLIEISKFPAVSCGEFRGQSNSENYDHCLKLDQLVKPEDRVELQLESLGYGPTIIYVPTRKETISIARFLCESGIKAAAYNARVYFTINYVILCFMHHFFCSHIVVSS